MGLTKACLWAFHLQESGLRSPAMGRTILRMARLSQIPCAWIGTMPWNNWARPSCRRSLETALGLLLSMAEFAVVEIRGFTDPSLAMLSSVLPIFSLRCVQGVGKWWLYYDYILPIVCVRLP